MPTSQISAGRDAVIQSVSSMIREKPSTADALPQELLALGVPSSEEDSLNPAKLPVCKPESSSQQHESAKLGCRKRIKSAERGAVLQSVIIKKREKPCSADALPQDQSALSVPTRNFMRPYNDIKQRQAGSSTG
jgi:hypothetical protein